jgi:hypothetical protein
MGPMIGHSVLFSALASSAAIEAAHFPAETTRPLGPRLSAIFTLSLLTEGYKQIIS